MPLPVSETFTMTRAAAASTDIPITPPDSVCRRGLSRKYGQDLLQPVTVSQDEDFFAFLGRYDLRHQFYPFLAGLGIKDILHPKDQFSHVKQIKDVVHTA